MTRLLHVHVETYVHDHSPGADSPCLLLSVSLCSKEGYGAPSKDKGEKYYIN